jgi:dTDP-4-amino-4,6-dideoxygalactose transaminase
MSQLAILGGSKAVTQPFPRWPEWNEKDTQAVSRAVATGKWWMYDYGTAELAAGDETRELSCVERFERTFAKAHRAKHALAVNSGTSALDVCIRALNLQPGEEVITTPYTFFATSSCVLNAGAWPVYVDIDPQTYNMDPGQIESAITERTRAILPVHFAGDLCDMDAINAIARKHGLAVIEDAAQSQGVCLSDNRFAGTFGLAGTFSFQASKCLSCGEGGLILTDDDRFADLCWSLRHCGRSRDGLWYEHARLGWNLRMPELPAALLLTQFERLGGQNHRRMANVKYFGEGIADVGGLALTKPHPQAKTRNHYLVILRYDASRWDGVSRDRFVQALNAEGVPALPGYTLLNFENPVFDQLKCPFDYRSFSDRCPHAVRASREQAVWLMHSLFLGDAAHVDAIVGAITKIRENLEELR